MALYGTGGVGFWNCQGVRRAWAIAKIVIDRVSEGAFSKPSHQQCVHLAQLAVDPWCSSRVCTHLRICPSVVAFGHAPVAHMPANLPLRHTPLGLKTLALERVGRPTAQIPLSPPVCSSCQVRTHTSLSTSVNTTPDRRKSLMLVDRLDPSGHVVVVVIVRSVCGKSPVCAISPGIRMYSTCAAQ